MLNGHLLKRAHAKLPTEKEEIAALRARYKKASPEDRKKAEPTQIAQQNDARRTNQLKHVVSSPDFGVQNEGTSRVVGKQDSRTRNDRKIFFNYHYEPAKHRAESLEKEHLANFLQGGTFTEKVPNHVNWCRQKDKKRELHNVLFLPCMASLPSPL